MKILNEKAYNLAKNTVEMLKKTLEEAKLHSGNGRAIEEEIKEYEDSMKEYLDMDKNSINHNDEEFYDPILSNRFVVDVSDMFDVRENEITSFHCIGKRKFIINFAESSRRNILRDIFNAESLGRTGNITIKVLKNDLTPLYTRLFKRCNVTDVMEREYNYSNDSISNFDVYFSYDYMTFIDDDATDKEENS